MVEIENIRIKPVENFIRYHDEIVSILMKKTNSTIEENIELVERTFDEIIELMNNQLHRTEIFDNSDHSLARRQYRKEIVSGTTIGLYCLIQRTGVLNMSNNFNSRTSIADFWIMLMSIHEVTQRNIFYDLEDDFKDRLIRSFINNDRYAALRNTAFEKNGNAVANRAIPVQNLLHKSQKFLENDRNYRLLSVENSSIFCQNTESYKDENDFNVDLRDTIITPQHKLEFAKRNYS